MPSFFVHDFNCILKPKFKVYQFCDISSARAEIIGGNIYEKMYGSKIDQQLAANTNFMGNSDKQSIYMEISPRLVVYLPKLVVFSSARVFTICSPRWICHFSLTALSAIQLSWF